jgi:predicted nucleotidyltransferase
MRAVGERHGARNLRVFGSVARGEDRADSDLDVVADLPTGMGLFELGTMERELSEIMGMKVDLVPVDGLRPQVRAEVEAEAVDL